MEVNGVGNKNKMHCLLTQDIILVILLLTDLVCVLSYIRFCCFVMMMLFCHDDVSQAIICSPWLVKKHS